MADAQPIQIDADIHLTQRIKYLEGENKRMYSENDLLRTAMQTHALEGIRLMNFYPAFKIWQDNGCRMGDKTCAALLHAYREAGEA